MNRLALAACAAAVASGCASRCKQVESERVALRSRRGATDRAADLRVSFSLAQANPLIADLLRTKPLMVPLDLPDLGPTELAVHGQLTATATEVRIESGPADTLRFATRIAVRDDERDVTTLAAEIDVTPTLQRSAGAAELAVGFGPKDLVSVRPVLGDDAKSALGDAVARRLPERLRGKIPKVLLDEAAARLASQLTGSGFELLRHTLFERLGELTAWRVKLPDVPIATHAIRSTKAALVVEIVTDLPVRHGLDGPGLGPTNDMATVELAGSVAAELANWTIDRGYAPRWYDDGLQPRADGEFTPRFDYVPGDGHPFKIHLFQERGGCSYFRVGVHGAVGMDGDRLNVTAVDRVLEATFANPVIEAAAAAKFFLFGWIDESKQIAARTRVTLGGRPLETRVTSAVLDHDELRFGLAFAAR